MIDPPLPAAELARSRARVAELEQELDATHQSVLLLQAELHGALAELTEKTRLVQEADRLKGEFLANMSHEIRTPMNAIIGLTEVLLRGSLNRSQRESLDIIQESGKSLLALINDILDFSKIEAGKLDLEAVDFAPAYLIERTAALLRGLAQEKKLNLQVLLDPNLPPVLRGDRNRLRQILLNLLANAIKFTTRGGIVVQVTALQPSGIMVTVKDTGKGISAEAQARLFQPFVQEDGSITREHGGTGLGLSICKRLVELMGGEIWVESAPDQGSTFGFRVPLALGAAAPIEALVVVDEAGPRPAMGARVLVAEDHPANRLVAKYQLELLGLQVEFVGNGREAVAAAKASAYDLILMDCHMPDMSGYEATREIRQAERITGNHVPIVAMTAGALASDRVKCLESGMDDYISKPVEAATLGAVLSIWLPVPGEAREAEVVIDFKALESNYGPVLTPQLARLFEHDASLEVQGLLRAAKEQDATAIATHGHGLRGLGGTICSALIVSDCDSLRHARDRRDWPAIERGSLILAANFERARRLLRERYPVDE